MPLALLGDTLRPYHFLLGQLGLLLAPLLELLGLPSTMPAARTPLDETTAPRAASPDPTR